MTTTAVALELRDILNTWRRDADVLRLRGDARAAMLLEQCAADAARVAYEFTDWLSEVDAAKRSGWSGDKVRRHARLYVNTPHVAYDRKAKAYRLRACIVPRRTALELVQASA